MIVRSTSYFAVGLFSPCSFITPYVLERRHGTGMNESSTLESIIVSKSSTQAVTGVEPARGWDMVPTVGTHCTHTMFLSQTR